MGPTGMQQDSVTAHLDSALRQRVFDSISVLLPRVLGQEIPAVSNGTKLMAELGLRSATMLELLLELEDNLEIQIEVEDIDHADMDSGGDLAYYVARHAIVDG